MAEQKAAAQPAAAVPVHASLNNLLGTQNGTPRTTSTVNQGSAAANGQPVKPLGALSAGLSNGGQSQSPANVPQNPFAVFLPQPQAPIMVPQNPAPIGQDAQAQFQLLQLLAAQGIPPDEWATALQLLNLQGAIGIVPANNRTRQATVPSRDQDTHNPSPPSQSRRRPRSPYDRQRELSPQHRRDSPGAGQCRSHRDGRGDGRRGNDYRQRIPASRGQRSPTPPRNDAALPPPGPKSIQYDSSLPKGHIKVFSRTLFVGGVTSSEVYLRGLFSKYGVVQTCIVNVEKRHAFVKMINRKDAESARNGMEEYRTGDTQLCVSGTLPAH
jgi:protein NRD1